MSEPKWTPGPWHVGTVYACHSNIESNRGRVAQTECDVRADQGRNSADAHLIAAAPALYDELAAIVEAEANHWPIGDVCPDWLTRARAVLAKARGETA